MGRKLELTPMPSSNRWRKKYKNHIYYLPGCKSKSDYEGYRLALVAWRAKKAEIDANDPNNQAYEQAIRIRKDMVRVCHSYENDELSSQLQMEITQLRKQNAARNPPKLTTPEIDPLRRFPLDEQVLWMERLRQLQVLDEVAEESRRASRAHDKSIEGNIDRFLQRMQVRALGREISLGRYDAYRCCLDHFKKWVGGTNEIDFITARTLLDYHTYLLEEVSRGMSRAYASGHVGTVRRFIRWCWTLDLLPLPKNIDDKEITISVPNPPIKVFTVDEFKSLLSGASSSTRLYLLLMLNCGYQQQDIAELKRQEIDWERGRIARKRSKTGNHANVPIVEYRLWDETFALLKKHGRTDTELVLLNQKGGPLKAEMLVNGKIKKIDNIRSAYNRLVHKLKMNPMKPLKVIRKTGASKLAEHPEYGRFDRLYLGHAPTSIKDKHYVQTPQNLFDEAILWLGKQFDLA